jgi:hypothetical protein
MAYVRQFASVLLPLLVVLAALGVAAHVARTGLPVQGGPIHGGPGSWRTTREGPPPSTVPFPFLGPDGR